MLRLLRPAEAATRRLIIVAAREIVVTPPPPPSAVPLPRFAGEEPAPTILRNGLGIAIVMPHARPPALPLFDPLRRPFRRRRPTQRGVPRICVPGYSAPFPLPPLPSPNDPVDAARLGRRLAALASALDDLPAHARRFARWWAKRDALAVQDRDPDAAGAQGRESRNLPHRRGRPRRISPLRLGRPPGSRRRSAHEVHEVLKDVHQLAFWALERPDTS